MDMFNKNKRSEIMKSIRAKNTKPEKRVLNIINKLNYDIILHDKDFPGCPDMILPEFAIALFVHGCFWHQHKGCKRCFTPKTNKSYWIPKLDKNRKRFNSQRKLLNKYGWHAYVIWECETKKEDILLSKIAQKLKMAK
jgi:DNA mismatch endonuclease (patch repair protein)